MVDGRVYMACSVHACLPPYSPPPTLPSSYPTHLDNGEDVVGDDDVVRHGGDLAGQGAEVAAEGRKVPPLLLVHLGWVGMAVGGGWGGSCIGAYVCMHVCMHVCVRTSSPSVWQTSSRSAFPWIRYTSSSTWGGEYSSTGLMLFERVLCLIVVI